MYRKWIKAALDRLLAFCLLVLAFPLFLLIMTILLVTQGRPVFFRQQRSGIHNRIFLIWKFRTLKKRSQGQRYQIKADDFTPLGKMLRKSSIDEIPQLVNVLKGEMAFVGPRPLPPEYYARMEEKYRDRYTVKPGITGLAQISGRNNLTWRGKFDFDIQYVRHVGFAYDLGILLRTIPYLLSDTGINANGMEGMPEYEG